jgi:hypothetical protein
VGTLLGRKESNMLQLARRKAEIVYFHYVQRKRVGESEKLWLLSVDSPDNIFLGLSTPR